jgi:hypothetical protein
MILKTLRKILGKHAWLHLIIPLLVGLLFHSLVSHYREGRGWETLLKDLMSFQTAVFVVGLFVTYLLIMYHLIKKETSMKIRGTDLALLDGTLAQAHSYFATSTIGMEEWFDPISQVFLACIVKRKLQQQAFRDERVLLFSRRGEIEELNMPYLDGYYARRVAELHIHWGTPLGFLGRRDIFGALSELSFEERKKLGCYPGWLAWCPDRLLRSIPLNWVRVRMPELDFALVENQDGNKSVLLVSKRGEDVRVFRVTKTDVVSAYAKFVETMRGCLFKAGGTHLAEEHDFIKFFNPFASPGQSAAAVATPNEVARPH